MPKQHPVTKRPSTVRKTNTVAARALAVRKPSTQTSRRAPRPRATSAKQRSFVTRVRASLFGRLSEHPKPRRKQYHTARATWLLVLVVGLVGVQVGAILSHAPHYSPFGSVLSYATSMSGSDLATLTNQQRTAAGLAPLTVNAKLTAAAQAKANHMIANNYWAHVAPDGTTPWYFFDQAGYSYIRAGENLAYGFATSADAIQGWMNSPGHKANILGDYKDVGFGIANGANFQGGEFTVVVAEYGATAAAAVATPVQTNPTPAPASVNTSVPAASTPAPATEAPADPVPATQSVPATQNVAADANKPIQLQAEVKTNAPDDKKTVTVANAALTPAARWSMFASLSIIGIVFAGLLFTHLRFVRKEWHSGVGYVLHHPLIDATIVVVAIALALSSKVGFIN